MMGAQYIGRWLSHPGSCLEIKPKKTAYIVKMTVWTIWTTLFTMFSKCWGWFAWPVLNLPFPYWFICYLWSSHRCIWSDELQTYKWWAGSCLRLSLWIKLERTPNPATLLRLFWVINFFLFFFYFLTNGNICKKSLTLSSYVKFLL